MKRSHLLIFDIDGTLTNTTGVDDRCIEKAMRDAGQINIENLDWSAFTHPTDEGILTELLPDDPKKIALIKRAFLDLLANAWKSSPDDFSEVTGAADLLARLVGEGFEIAIATGSWEISGRIKLQGLNYPTGEVPYGHCDFDKKRIIIASKAVELAKRFYDRSQWDHTTYFGDGIWDYTTAKHHGFNFVGIDFLETHTLSDAGIRWCFKDWLDQNAVIDLLEHFEGRP